MKLSGFAVTVAVAISVTGCASSSDDIGASYVSPFTYQNYTCQQLAEESERINARVHEVAGDVDSKATNDKVAMGVGLVLFWPALLMIKGNGPEHEELARLKGEYDAVNEAMIRQNCSSYPASAATSIAPITQGSSNFGARGTTPEDARVNAPSNPANQRRCTQAEASQKRIAIENNYTMIPNCQ